MSDKNAWERSNATADDLADAIEDWETGANYTLAIKVGKRLREQAKYIAQLECENEFLKDWRDAWSPFIKQQCVANNDMTQECVAKTEK